MTRTLSIAWCLATAVAGPVAGQRARPPAPSPLAPALAAATPELMAAVGTFLADTLLRGRTPGTVGGTIAARFLAAQFQALGLLPGSPDGSYLQAVPLLRVRARPALVLAAGRETFTPKAPDDVVLWPLSTDSSVDLDGELVFAGFGLEAPALHWDDYKGVPQTGRIMLVLAGEPQGADSIGRVRADTWHGQTSAKLQQAAKMGAAGILFVYPSGAPNPSWTRFAPPLTGDQLWLESSPGGPAPLKFAGWIREDLARAVLQTAGRDFQLLRRRAHQPEFSPINTGVHAAIHISTETTKIRGYNVVARVPGSDSAAASEPVIVAAPYVRLAGDERFWRDSGSAGSEELAAVSGLVAAAAGAARIAPAARRPMLFVAAAGRPGATQFATTAPGGRGRTVAVVYMEGSAGKGAVGIPVLGAGASSVGDVARLAAQSEGADLEPEPDAGLMESGTLSLHALAAPILDLRAEWSPRTARVALRITWALASSTQFPSWLSGQPPWNPVPRP